MRSKKAGSSSRLMALHSANTGAFFSDRLAYQEYDHGLLRYFLCVVRSSEKVLEFILNKGA